MLQIARRPENDRRDLFRATAERMRINEAIVEKDFWVCWTLDYLFQDSPWKERLAFKGGTSLSKGYHAIERFSEDIDVVLDWMVLGYSADEPWSERSGNKQQAFGKQCYQRTRNFLANEFVPTIRPQLQERAGAAMKIETRELDVLIEYPKAFSLDAIQPQIKLEIGPMASWIPNEQRPISPYAADLFPHLFTQLNTSVRTILATRTFWEKATILHQEAHREKQKSLPPRYSRHYYDVYRLNHISSIRNEALSRIGLLQAVVAFKMRFYRCPWAKYEDAKPGTLMLLPPDHHRDELEKDYQAMHAMLFGKIPAFETIMTDLAGLEKEINRLGAAAEQ